MEEDLTEIPKLTQMELDQLAQSLEICYAVVDNLTDGHATYQASLTLRNKGDYSGPLLDDCDSFLNFRKLFIIYNTKNCIFSLNMSFV